MRRSLGVLVCLMLTLPPATSAAQSESEWFVRGFGGLNIIQGSELDLDNVPFDVDVAFDDGYAVGAAAGYLYQGLWRGEVEVIYRRNEISELVASDDMLPPGSGRAHALSVMVNVFREFDTGGIVRPFFGLGFGATRLTYKDVIASVAPFGSFDVRNESDTVFTFQVGVGVAVRVAEGLDVTVDYRYLYLPDPDFGRIETEYQPHSFLAGLRARF